jgi:hypothetical protein
MKLYAPGGENQMDDELLASIEREVLGWPGVSKHRHKGRPGSGRVLGSTSHRLQVGPQAHIGHIHDTGVADITFPREIHERLITEGRAQRHGAGFGGVVSYTVGEPEDVPRVVELLRMSYHRAKDSAERRGAQRRKDAS